MMPDEELKYYDQAMINIAYFISQKTTVLQSPADPGGVCLPKDQAFDIEHMVNAYLKLAKAGLIRKIDPDKVTPEILEVLK